MNTYIQLYLQHNEPAVIPHIVEAIREAVVMKVVVKDGDAFVEMLSDKDIMHESFSLGILFKELREKYNILNPFLWELVTIEEELQ